MSEERKILLVMDSLYTGGAEYSTLLWMQYLLQRGYNARLVLLKRKKPEYSPETFHIDTSKIIRIKEKHTWMRFLALRRLISHERPDVVHSVLTVSSLLCRFVRISGITFRHIESLVNQPYSAQRLNSGKVALWKIKTLKLWDRHTWRLGVEHFHANSAAVANHYKAHLGIPSSKISVVRRGRMPNLNLSNRSAMRRHIEDEFGIPEDHLILINVGRHEYQKGQEVLIKAVKELRKQGLKVSLIIAGREGDMTDQLNRYIRTFSLRNCVHLAGHRNDIPELLAGADLFVFPSRYEGLPGALIEACGARLPIICTDLPCMTEVVTAGRNALLFKLDDVESLTRCISRMIEDQNMVRRFGAESSKIFLSQFNLQVIHRNMMRILQRTFVYTEISSAKQ